MSKKENERWDLKYPYILYHFFQVIFALASEFQECLLKQQAGVDTAYTKLDFLRDLSNIQIQQAKVLTSPSGT